MKEGFLALDQIKTFKNRPFDSFCNILHHVESDIYHDKRTTFVIQILE